MASEGAPRDAAGDIIKRTVSLDAYRRNVGGSITIAVTGTDNPVPSQLERQTPPQATPAVKPESDAAADADPVTSKSKKKKKS